MNEHPDDGKSLGDILSEALEQDPARRRFELGLPTPKPMSHRVREFFNRIGLALAVVSWIFGVVILFNGTRSDAMVAFIVGVILYAVAATLGWIFSALFSDV